MTLEPISPTACIMETPFQASLNTLTGDSSTKFLLLLAFFFVIVCSIIVVYLIPSLLFSDNRTITATITGLIDHADSAGNGGRYGDGDLQWMTAGKGIVHSEMFPLLKEDAENPLRFFQIWLNLPARSKMVQPAFEMFWAETVPVYQTDDGKASATLFVGHNYFDVTKNPNSPPPDSWANDPSNDVVVCHMTIQPGGKLVLPKAHEETANRSLYYIEGKSNEVIVDGEPLKAKVFLTLDPASEETVLEVPESALGPAEFLWLQGKPIEEPVTQHGPFVMNTRQEIVQAFAEYRETEFGGWPWPRDDMVFPASKGRFSLFNGEENAPPDVKADANGEEKKKDEGEL